MRIRFAVALLVLGPLVSSAEIDRAFLKELLEIPSVTADIPAVNRAMDLTQAWLVRHGVRCQVETDDRGRKILWAATVDGTTPDYVFVGHLDVVPAEADQFKVRFDGEKIIARGTHDNKGNAVLTCDVLRRLNGKASVGAVFAADEEMGGSTVGLLVKRGYRPRKMGIVLDAGTYGVYYAQKGNAYLTVRATGKGGHSSRALWLDNPIEKLMRGYETFKREWPSVPKDGWGDLVVPTVVRAGQAENAIPDTAEMVLNVRSVSTDAVERVTAAIEKIPGLEVVKVRSTGKPMASDPDDPEIQRLLAERRARWPGKDVALQKMLAITDARHLAGLGVPVVITGSIGGNAHGKDEWGDMKSMDENADSLVAFIEDDGRLARAFRGVWLATVSDARFSDDLSKKSVDGIKAHWRGALDAAAKVNVNAVFFQVRPCADAFYADALEPWSQHLRGEQGKAPEDGFDPLRFMIDECHARGLQLHAWFNPFRVTYDEGDEKRLAKDHNYFRHPEWFVKYGKSVYYDPGVPACRDWTVQVVMDVVSRYDVDGVHIDDYFYPYDIKDKAGKVIPFPDEKSFAKYGGGFTDVDAWRDDNSDRLVEELARRLRERKPDVAFGVAPYNDNGYCLKYLHCDSLKWAKRGWVDYLIPQLYYGENSRRQTFWWDAHAQGCALFAGLRLMTLQQTVEKGPQKGMPELDNVLGMLNQTTNTTGVCWWPGNLMATSQSNVVSRLAPHYAHKTLVPLLRHRSRTPPDAVTEVRTEARGGRIRLTWRHPAPSAGRPKGVFTAVYRGSSAHPETVTDTTEVLLDAAPGERFRLVALDRLQNASEPVMASVAVGLQDEITAVDRADDAAVAAITTPAELAAKQAEWRAVWIAGLGGLPERTPLNAKEGPVVRCDGFTLQNVLFESQPGVYVVGHLALPDSPAFKPPYPAVLMPMGHSDNGILAPRYAAHLADMARAGFAAFSWDPISQGERRQNLARYDATFQECAAEHARLGFRGWLVGWNFARFRIWDGMRALDWLETRPDVDGSNVGICGTSGGGTMSTYLQALDSRIKVAFPNCYVSSIRAVFAERGCHDAEQFFWNQLNVGVNHAAMLAMGYPRVSLATGSRWADYFPHKGAVETFAVYSNLCSRIVTGRSGIGPYQPSTFNLQPSTCTPWHFHCAGPHGLPLPTRQAQVDWMTHGIKGGPAPKPLADYWALSTGDHSGTNDPCAFAALPFPTNAAFFTASRQVRDLEGFRSVYEIIAERANALAKNRMPKTREELREIVRRRANIRPLSRLRDSAFDRLTIRPFDHSFPWWYLSGAYGFRRENEAAMLATIGRTVVGRDAERIILDAARHKPRILRAAGWDCIAAAHAYAAEPQLFTGIEIRDPPPSWTAMVTNPDPKNDSFAMAVWGALEEYDWTDLVERKEDTPCK